MPTIDHYLYRLLEVGGSDLLLMSGICPTIKLHGRLRPLDEHAVQADEVDALLYEILDDAQRQALPLRKNLDFAYESTIADTRFRFRANAYFQKEGLSLVMRAINNEVPRLEDLGLPPAVRQLTEYHQGLVLVTGPSGSGKTTTIAAMVHHLNQTRRVHVLTIEDPLEYLHSSALSLINQRQVGRDVESFATALRGALREDPDVIMIGELRDAETIQLAITAAETGHLVFSTLHTNSAAKTIDRLVDAFPMEQQGQIRNMLSESIRGIVTQQLVPRLDGNGQALAVEILITTASVSNLIREGKTFQIPSLQQTGRSLGMKVMDHSLLELVQNGTIDVAEARRRISDPDILKGVAK